MKFTIIKNGAIFAVASGDERSVEAIYQGCEIHDGEYPPTEFSFVNGKFLRRPQISPAPAASAEINTDDARVTALAKRGQLLARTDWTQLPDVPLETKAAWAEYRQALRDITGQPGFPFEIEWPEAPK